MLISVCEMRADTDRFSRIVIALFDRIGSIVMRGKKRDAYAAFRKSATHLIDENGRAAMRLRQRIVIEKYDVHADTVHDDGRQKLISACIRAFSGAS
jgi:hypothetical protein